MSTHTSRWLAPAKLNLFVHIIAVRPSGYHRLQTAFQLIGLYDELTAVLRQDEQIIVTSNTTLCPASNLVYRAARLLQKHTACPLGATLHLHKRIPIGQGLGGGSSDAATTLLALQQLWVCPLSHSSLMALGLQLGADIPFFLFGHNAIADGVGERCQRIVLPRAWYVLAHHATCVSTQHVFQHNNAYTLAQSVARIRHQGDFLQHPAYHNDLEQAALQAYPAIQAARDFLRPYGRVHLSGSGGTFFVRCRSYREARLITRHAPPNVFCRVVASLPHHPHRVRT